MLELRDDKGNLLPLEVQKRINDFIEHLKEITWLKPSKDLKKSEVDKQTKLVLKCFGIEADIEYRKLETNVDWYRAGTSAWDLAWNSAYNLASDLASDLAKDCNWNSAWDSVWDFVWDCDWNSARESDWASIRATMELLVIDNEDFKEKYPNGAFTQLFKLGEMGLYPIGVLEENKKFVIYANPKYCLKKNGWFE